VGGREKVEEKKTVQDKRKAAGKNLQLEEN